MSDAYEPLLALLREVATLSSVTELLDWDQETMMPRKAAAFRAEEKAFLSRLIHRRLTDPRLGDLLARSESDLASRDDPEAAANVREIRRDHDRALKLPEDLVAEISETSALAVEAWRASREESDFDGFRPWMEKQVGLNRRKAECLGTSETVEPYDALLDDFEPGMTSREVERIFEPLRNGLTPLIEAIASSAHRPDDGPARVEIPIERQKAMSRFVLAAIGFDGDAGRLDESTHPFSIGLGPGDTRITTRYRVDDFLDSLGSTMHEAGHGLYEQGLPKARLLGQPLAEPLGLGAHESQSRLWENHVGRSRPFWAWALPQARRLLGAPFEPFSVDEVYGAVNRVRPNLIRVESDEATYNLHIMLRFDLERAMIQGDLSAADLPAAWNERIERDLGLQVPDDRRGCLQDVHWASGAFGYFPTYTLGTLYAAQLWEAVEAAFPDVQEQLARGEFGALLEWLRANVHEHGRRYPVAELFGRVTGTPVSHEPLMRHLNGKLRPLYGLDL